MSEPDAIDESWGKADPATLRRRGVVVVAGYLSYDPAKNMSPAQLEALHREGIGWVPNWESQAGAPLQGARRGADDALESCRQLVAMEKAVGYAARSTVAIPYSCDTDTNRAERHGPVRSYYANTRSVGRDHGRHNGCYGEADLCRYLHELGLTDMEWETYAWSGGKLDPSADLYQYSNDHRVGGADVDFDRVIHLAQLGAWWPPGHPLDKPTGDVEWGDIVDNAKALAKIRQMVADEVKDALKDYSTTAQTRGMVHRALLAGTRGIQSGLWTRKRYPALIEHGEALDGVR